MVNVGWLWLAFLMPACPATDGFLGRSLSGRPREPGALVQINVYNPSRSTREDVFASHQIHQYTLGPFPFARKESM